MSKLLLNGSTINPLENRYYVCYVITTPAGKTYVGSTSGNKQVHEVGSRYFTSSSNKSFVDDFKKFTKQFNIEVRYFNSKLDSTNEEFRILDSNRDKFDGLFINKIIVPNNTCNEGNVTTTTGIVTKEEFSSGDYTHPSEGTQNVYNNEGVLIKIRSEDFDDKIHTKELSNKVHCFDNELGRNIRVSSEEFIQNPQRYTGVTTGFVSCYDTINKVFKSVSQYAFDSNDNLVGVTSRLSPLYDEKKLKGVNSGMVVCYSLQERKSVRIETEAYQQNKKSYLNSASKGVYFRDGKFYSNKSKMKGNKDNIIFLSLEEIKVKYLEITTHEI